MTMLCRLLAVSFGLVVPSISEGSAFPPDFQIGPFPLGAAFEDFESLVEVSLEEHGCAVGEFEVSVASNPHLVHLGLAPGSYEVAFSDHSPRGKLLSFSRRLQVADARILWQNLSIAWGEPDRRIKGQDATSSLDGLSLYEARWQRSGQSMILRSYPETAVASVQYTDMTCGKPGSENPENPGSGLAK